MPGLLETRSCFKNICVNLEGHNSSLMEIFKVIDNPIVYRNSKIKTSNTLQHVHISLLWS